MASPTFLNPLGFSSSNWLINQTDHDKEPGENIEAGLVNDFETGDDVKNFTTIVVNVAPQSAAFAASNQSSGLGAVGVYGESISSTGVGVVGASTGIGVAGVAKKQSIDIPDNPHPFVGVFGSGDTGGVLAEGSIFGVQGNSDNGIGVEGNGQIAGVSGSGTVGVFGVQTTQQSPPKASNPVYAHTGIVGVGEARGGIFQAIPNVMPSILHPGITGLTPQLANVQLTPVVANISNLKSTMLTPSQTIPVLPTNATAGDMLMIQLANNTGQVDPGSTQLWLCTRTGRPDGKLPTVWARVHLDISVSLF
ncbi:MAG TPA: hypothetical protein VKZ53_00510 [Candidatus Angelobacter sp.]|nr:hypothetical protein [Candidatus Angelobacter sp.]